MNRQPIRLYLFLITCLVCSILQFTQPLMPLMAQTAVACPDVGGDGSGNIGGNVDTYYEGLTDGSISAGATSFNLGPKSPIGAATDIDVGDLILIMQMQDALANYANTAAYGDGVGGDVTQPNATYPGGTGGSSGIPYPPATAASGYTNLRNAGYYEYAIVTGVSGSLITIRGGGSGGGLLYTYENRPSTGTQSKRSYQVIRVPQYGNITLSSANPLVPPPWNGQAGGVLAIDVAGTLNMTGGVVIEASGRGFRGGASRQLTGAPSPPNRNTDFRTFSTVNVNGGKGEGISGTPRYVINYFDPFTLDAQFNPPNPTLTDTGVANDGYPNGSHARGAPGNAGGGGTDGNPVANDENAGGGGGGNAGDGGNGGRAWNSQAPSGGFGGKAIPLAVVNNGQRLFMGGGGGGGTTNNGTRADNRPVNFNNITNSSFDTFTPTNPGIFSSGAGGGGLIMVRTGSISGSGTFRARGATGLSAGPDAGGGGGAGGTVYVVAIDTTNIASISADVRGGDGGWSAFRNAHGPGGGGGGGAVISTNPGISIISISGGEAGKTGPDNNADVINGTNQAVSGTGITANIPQIDNYGTPPTATCRARVLTVKRITALNGSTASLTSFIDETNPANNPNDDNSPSWPPSYLIGGGTTSPTDPFNNGTLQVKPGDTLDYTIYFINAGGSRAINFRICDAIPANTEFVPDTYNSLSPTDGGLPSNLGMALAIGSATPTAYLSNIDDPPDRGQYYPPGQVPPNCRDIAGNPVTSNPNGFISVNVNRTSFPNLPANTVAFPSTQNYGFARFRVRVK